jgi:hypothetical protein
VKAAVNDSKTEIASDNWGSVSEAIQDSEIEESLPKWFNLTDAPSISTAVADIASSTAHLAESQSDISALPAWFSLPESTDNDTATDIAFSNTHSVAQISPQENSQVILPSWFNSSVSESNFNASLSPTFSAGMGSVLPSSPSSSWIESIASTSVEVIVPDVIRDGEVVTFTVIAINDPTPASDVVLTSTMPTASPCIQYRILGSSCNEIIHLPQPTRSSRSVSGTIRYFTNPENQILFYTPFTVNPSIPAESITVNGPQNKYCETVTIHWFTATIPHRTAGWQ